MAQKGRLVLFDERERERELGDETEQSKLSHGVSEVGGKQNQVGLMWDSACEGVEQSHAACAASPSIWCNL